ncbi:MAG: peptide ABC transporter substrate-binding protein [Bdellovibrionaceae bacterium]|nr:peptide ABC transporter substrate-binding protein [Pseudobdellovibrionaceae bacterium]
MLRLLLAVLCFSTVLLSCSKNKTKLPHGLNKLNTLTINLSTEPPSLDWNKATDRTSFIVINNIMEGLATYDYKDPKLKVIPALAASWKSFNQSQKWVFTLKKNVVWSDGKPLTAQHFVDGWKRLLSPKTASEYAYFLYPIKNAQLFNQGKLKDFSKVGVSVNKKGQLVVILEGPKSYFPSLMTHGSTYPVRMDIINKYKDRWTEPKNIVTLGAYTLNQWEHDKLIVFKKNPNYYGVPAVIPNVLAYMVSEMSTAVNLFDSKLLDIQAGLPSTELSSLKKRKEYRQFSILSTYYYGFNTKKEPFNKPLVRQAFSLAVNQKEITKLLSGGEKPLYSWIPSPMFGHNPSIGLRFDVKKARKLLDKAGFKDRSKFPKIALSFNTNENHQRIAENIQAQLKKNLGVFLELKNEEWKVYLNRLKTDTPHMFRLGWLSDYPDPDDYMSLMLSYSDNNHTYWKNKKYDNLVLKASRVQNKKQRLRLYNQAQKLLIETDTPVLPIYSGVSYMLISPRIDYYPFNSMNRAVFKDVRFKK